MNSNDLKLIRFWFYANLRQKKFQTVGMIKEILEKACGSICFENKLKAYVYDGIWTLALAFHNVSMRYKSNHGTLYDPRLFSSNYSDIHADLLQEITSTLFEGVTVCLLFFVYQDSFSCYLKLVAKKHENST